jgi:uncharacterized membrane protein
MVDVAPEKLSQPGRSFWRRIGNYFIAGLVVVAPLGLTIFIIWWLFTSIDNLLQPIVTRIFGHPIQGVGFGAIIVIIFLAGVITSNFIGKNLLRYLENYLVSRIPLVRQLYDWIKQISEAFSAKGKSMFLGVVLVDFPSKGVKSIGFITNSRKDESGTTCYHIFVPTVPNPTTGFLLILKEEEFVRTNLSTEDAIKMVVSIGKYSPKLKS